MSELKTKVNEANVREFINSVQSQTKKEDSLRLLEMFERITGETPKMWGASIVGFGSYHYKSERSRQQGDWLLTGFSPRKQNLTLYTTSGLDDAADLLRRLGKHKKSVGCLYINKLSDVDLDVLAEIIKRSYESMKAQYGIDNGQKAMS